MGNDSPITVQDLERFSPLPPSPRANYAFWISVVNTAGLVVLGAYCLKGAVDHAFAEDAAAALVRAFLWPWRLIA